MINIHKAIAAEFAHELEARYIPAYVEWPDDNEAWACVHVAGVGYQSMTIIFNADRLILKNYAQSLSDRGSGYQPHCISSPELPLHQPDSVQKALKYVELTILDNCSLVNYLTRDEKLSRLKVKRSMTKPPKYGKPTYI